MHWKPTYVKAGGDAGGMGKRWSLGVGVMLGVKAGPNLRLKLGDGQGKVSMGAPTLG